MAVDEDPGRGYVGRRRAPEPVMPDLVSANLAALLGDRDARHLALTRVYQALYAAGNDTETVDRIVARLDPQARHEAEQICVRTSQWFRELGETDEPELFCTDPWLHWRYERGSAQEHRPPSTAKAGCCKWCGRPFQRKDIP